ncbi:hypothetical protein ACFWUP_02140 [Nocardia sp. NPDC058658]|uniref:hypothetical protein n=1 Tax=Nocardia sp. NPDC058658 TaxID=3346580 RepID=UPI003666692B
MSLSKLVLAVASAVGLLAIPAVANPPIADAAPLVPMSGFPGPVNGTVMSDLMNCLIDYTIWIDRDPQQPHRVVGHVAPRGYRSTIPGLPAPATCPYASIAASVSTDRVPVSIPVHAKHLVADSTGGPTVEFDLPYQPDAAWVQLTVGPLTQVAAIPIFATVFPNGGWNTTLTGFSLE